MCYFKTIGKQLFIGFVCTHVFHFRALLKRDVPTYIYFTIMSEILFVFPSSIFWTVHIGLVYWFLRKITNLYRYDRFLGGFVSLIVPTNKRNNFISTYFPQNPLNCSIYPWFKFVVNNKLNSNLTLKLIILLCTS